MPGWDDISAPVKAPSAPAAGWDAISHPVQAPQTAGGGWDAISHPVQQPANAAGSTMQQIAAIPGAGAPGQLSPSAAALQSQINPLNAQREQAQIALGREQQGPGMNFVAGALRPYAGIAGAAERGLGFQQAAENTENLAPAEGSVAGFAGQMVGGLPQMLAPGAGSVAAAVNQGELTHHGIEQARAGGADISTGAGALDVAGQALISGITNKLLGQGVSGNIAKTVEQTLAKELPGLAAKTGARAAAGAPIMAGQQLASNLVSKGTVNPQQKVTEGVGQAAAMGAGMEVAGGAIHDIATPKAEAPVAQPERRQATVPVENDRRVVANTEEMKAAYDQSGGALANPKPNDLLKRMRENRLQPGEAVPGTEDLIANPRPNQMLADRMGVTLKGPPKQGANPTVRDQAAKYAEQAGLEYKPYTGNAEVNPERGAKIASAYDDLKHEPNDPAVKSSYDAFKKETLAQFNFLKDQGVKMEPWTGEGQPYKNSGDMARDVKDGHLYFFQGKDMPEDHPLAENLPGDKNLTYNDAFRAVHDYFGHAKEGYQFGPRGEENAWMAHSAMYSDEARPAMTTETRGQNSWVNFGPHGEENQAHPEATIYAEQKAGLLPPEHQTPGEKSGGLLSRLAKDQSGGTEAGNKFVEREVKPVVGGIKQAFDETTAGLRRLFGFQKGAGVAPVKEAFKYLGADRAQYSDQLDQRYAPLEKTFGALSNDQMNKVTDRMERGVPQPTDELDKAAKEVGADYDEARQLLQERNPKFEGLDYYTRHLWKQPEKSGAVLQGIIARRPLAGQAGFMKGRTIPYASEAREAGLEPHFPNPAENAKEYLKGVKQLVSAQDLRDTLSAKGVYRKLPVDDRVPEGWYRTTTDDPLFRNGMVNDPEVNSVINNATMSGLGKYALGRGVRTAANAYTSTSLSLSARHATFGTLASSWSEMGRAWQDLAKLKPGSALGHAVQSVIPTVSAIKHIVESSPLRQAWDHPEQATPENQTIVEALKLQGGRVRQESAYKSDIAGKMWRELKDGNVGGAAWRAPFAAVETVSKPIMRYMIPALKDGVFQELGQSVLKEHPELVGNGKGLSDAMGPMWRSIENRYGEIVYDNRFINRTIKDASQIGLRAAGFTGGTWDEGLGGAKDVLTNLKGTLTPGEGNQLSHRAAFALGITTHTAIMGAVLTYLMTGHGPQSVDDYLNPPTGKKDARGNPEKLQVVNYLNEMQSALHSPTAYAAAKINPLISTVADIWRNKDFYGNQVRNEDSSIGEQLKDVGKYALKQAEPTSLQNLQSGKGAGSFVGVTKAPSYVTQSDAMQTAFDRIARHGGSEGRTPQEAERSQLISKIATAVRNHEPDAWQQFGNARGEGKLTWQDRKAITQRAKEPAGLAGLVHDDRLLPQDLMAIWGKATPDEQKSIRYQVRKRIMSANLPEAERQQYLQETQAHVTATP